MPDKLTDNLSNKSPILSNNLTDNEIKKALECCNTEYEDYQCPHCPLLHKGCKKALIQNAFDLINRQQAENEEFKAINESIKNDKVFLGKEIEKYHKELLKSKVFKFVRNPNRIYNIMDFQDDEILFFYDYPEKPSALSKGYLLFKGKEEVRLINVSEVKELSYTEVKAEAYKEYHTKAKACLKANRDIEQQIGNTYAARTIKEIENRFDNLLNELVGDADGDNN